MASQRELEQRQQDDDMEEDVVVEDEDEDERSTISTSLSHTLRHPISAFNDAYSSFLFANAQRLNKVESTARSLTWFVPAQSLSSEGVFTALNLLTLYHDALSNRPSSSSSSSSSLSVPASAATTLGLPVSPHSRYTKYWLKQSKLYKAVARLLSVVSYAQLLLEMAGKKYKGEAGRWRVVIGLESLKAVLRLLLLRLTSQRTVLQPSIPEREVDPAVLAASLSTSPQSKKSTSSSIFSLDDPVKPSSTSSGTGSSPDTWRAPRTGFEIPTISSIRETYGSSGSSGSGLGLGSSASAGSDGFGLMRVESEIQAFLQKKVLSVDSVRKPFDLVRRRRGLGVLAEVVWILRPLVYVLALKKYGKRSATPFLLSLALEYFSYRNMADTLASVPPSARSEVEKQELGKRSRAFWLYFLRGPVWHGWTRGKMVSIADATEGKLGIGLLSNIVSDYRSLIDEFHYYSSS